LKKVILLFVLSGTAFASENTEVSPCLQKGSVINTQKSEDGSYFSFNFNTSKSSTQYYKSSPIFLSVKENNEFVSCIKNKFPNSAYLSNTILIEDLNDNQLGELFSIVKDNPNVKDITLRPASEIVNTSLNKNSQQNKLITIKADPLPPPPANKNTLLQEITTLEQSAKTAFDKIQSEINKINETLKDINSDNPDFSKNIQSVEDFLKKEEVNTIKNVKSSANEKATKVQKEDMDVIKSTLEEIAKYAESIENIEREISKNKESATKKTTDNAFK
jgi:hypothetical protein